MPLLTSIMAASRRRVDPDAADYFARIVAAGSTISAGNQAAVNAFVRGCKTDGIWTAIKASCLLAGPDSLAGALVPLAGAAPTNFNFVAGDYSRTTGLLGDGSSKYLNLNRNNNADPQNSKHVTLWIGSIATTSPIPVYMGGDGALGSTQILDASGFFYRLNSSAAEAAGVAMATGFCGVNRASSTQTTNRSSGATRTSVAASASPTNEAQLLYRRNSMNLVSYANARISFYSIGESLDLALLDARLATYMSALT
jgi:hypothetical protein